MPLYGEEKRKYQREWMANRRQAWIDGQGGCCAKCKSMVALEVDHIDPSLKTMQPTSIWSRSHVVADLELSNCQVLCGECHLEKTLDERTPAEHGTNSMYSMGCRCDPCRVDHATAARAYRASRKLQNA